MRVFNLRLPETDYALAKSLADKNQCSVSNLLRQCIHQGLQAPMIYPIVKQLPRYALLTTASSVESVLLLRKIADTLSPTLAEEMRQLAQKTLQDTELTHLVDC